MRRSERTYEVKTNGIPQLKEMPKDLLNLFCTALLDAILEKGKKEKEETESISKK